MKITLKYDPTDEHEAESAGRIIDGAKAFDVLAEVEQELTDMGEDTELTVKEVLVLIQEWKDIKGLF